MNTGHSQSNRAQKRRKKPRCDRATGSKGKPSATRGDDETQSKSRQNAAWSRGPRLFRYALLFFFDFPGPPPKKDIIFSPNVAKPANGRDVHFASTIMRCLLRPDPFALHSLPLSIVTAHLFSYWAIVENNLPTAGLSGWGRKGQNDAAESRADGGQHA